MKVRNWLVVALLLGASAVAPRLAFAQVDPGAPDPAAAPPDPQPMTIVDTTNMAPPEPQPEPQYVMVMPEAFSQPRFRWGFSLQGGPTVPSGGDAGGNGGFAVRLGAQINRMWGAYYQGQVVFGGYVRVDASASEVNEVIFAAYYQTFAGSVILADRVEFAFGPSIDSVAALSIGASATSASARAFAGTGFGLNGHIGVILGRVDPQFVGRSGFSLTLDVHPTFIDGSVLFVTSLGLGGEWY